MQGADEIALTKLDVLSYLKEIPVCTAYEIDGERTTSFPSGGRLLRAKPVLETVPGWGCDIGACRCWEDLPQAAKDYVRYLEEKTGCRMKYISVGADRDSYITIEN